MPPQSSSQGDADNSLAPIWIAVGLALIFAFIWFFFKTEIIAFIFQIKYWEAQLLLKIVPERWAGSIHQAIDFIQDAKNTGYDVVTVKELYHTSASIGAFLRIPVVVCLIGFAIYLYLHNPKLHYKKTYSMFSLKAQEKSNWPQIVPISKLDLVKADINKGPWAMSIQPMDFAKRHGLLILEKSLQGQEKLASKAIIIATINRDEARKVFAAQLGPYWAGIEKTPIYYQALYAVFAARTVGDRQGAEKLLMQISRSTESGKLDFSGTKELLAKHKKDKKVVKINQSHAFLLTLMISMLEAARQDGVVASADFLWLKPLDRRLWYTLNSVGRQTPFVEVGGVFAHWLVEKELGRKLNLPMIEEAVNALEAAVKEQIYVPEDDEVV